MVLAIVVGSAGNHWSALMLNEIQAALSPGKSGRLHGCRLCSDTEIVADATGLRFAKGA